MMGVGYRAALCPPPQIASQAAAFHSAEPPMQPAHAAAPSLEGPRQRQALGEKRTAPEPACVTALTSAPPPGSARAIGRRLGARDRGRALRRKGRGEASGLAVR